MPFRAHCQHLRQCAFDVIDVPVEDRAARRGGCAFGSVFAVDDAELALIIAEAKFNISRIVGVGLLEIRFDAQQFRVPLRAAFTSAA